MDSGNEALAARVRQQLDAVRIALRRSEAADAVRLGRVARELRDVPPSVHSEGQLFALAGVCHYFQQPGRDNAQALEAAVLLGKRAHSLGRAQERMSALLNQGLIHDELDNHLEAVEAYAMARGVAAEIGLARAEVSTLVMAAQTLRNGGDPVGAEALASHALVVAERADEVDDLRALAWLTIAQWHLCVEEGAEGVAALRQARDCLDDDADPGLRATIDYVEVLLRLLTGDIAKIDSLLSALDRYAKTMGTLTAAIAFAAARGAFDLVQGRATGRARLVTALAKARSVPRALPDVLSAALVAAVALNEEAQAAQVREEMASLFEARRTAGQLRATLLRGPVVGLGALGKAFDTDTYERRLALAQERLLIGRS